MLQQEKIRERGLRERVRWRELEGESVSETGLDRKGWGKRVR